MYKWLTGRFLSPSIPQMKSIPAFSKEIVDMSTVSTDDDGCRAGFLEHVTSTNCGLPKAIPHMAGIYPTSSTLERTKSGGNPEHPEFKNRSDDGLGDYPAPFSKKNIPGTPKRTAGH